MAKISITELTQNEITQIAGGHFPLKDDLIAAAIGGIVGFVIGIPVGILAYKKWCLNPQNPYRGVGTRL